MACKSALAAHVLVQNVITEMKNVFKETISSLSTSAQRTSASGP